MGAPPRYAPAEVVKITKSITAREIFQRFPLILTEPPPLGAGASFLSKETLAKRKTNSTTET